MLLLSKKNTLWQATTAVLLSVALWAGAFVNPPDMPSVDLYAPLYDWLYLSISGYSRLCVVIAFVLSLAEALWLNVILYNHKLIPQNNLMPMLFYMLAMGCSCHTLTPLLIVNAFVLLMLTQLLATNVPSLTINRTFNAAACIGCCYLVYTPSIVLLLPLAVCYTFYKLYTWNDVAMLLLGFMAPVVLYLTCHILWGDIAFVAYLMTNGIHDIDFHIGTLSPLSIVAHVVMALAMVAFTIGTTSMQRSFIVMQQKKLQVVMVVMLFSVAIHAYTALLPIDMTAFAVAFGYAATCFFIQEKRHRWIDDCTYLLLLVACVIFSYYCQ